MRWHWKRNALGSESFSTLSAPSFPLLDNDSFSQKKTKTEAVTPPVRGYANYPNTFYWDWVFLTSSWDMLGVEETGTWENWG